jgi:hypothetical protein
MSIALGNSIVIELHQIRPRESQVPPTEESTIVETVKEAQYAQPPWGVKGIGSTSALSSEG